MIATTTVLEVAGAIILDTVSPGWQTSERIRPALLQAFLMPVIEPVFSTSLLRKVPTVSIF